jgi:hypothetical protein
MDKNFRDGGFHRGGFSNGCNYVSGGRRGDCCRLAIRKNQVKPSKTMQPLLHKKKPVAVRRGPSRNVVLFGLAGIGLLLVVASVFAGFALGGRDEDGGTRRRRNDPPVTPPATPPAAPHPHVLEIKVPGLAPVTPPKEPAATP